MKALITGADGFIGSHLSELLLEKGYHVRALSQYNSFNNWGWLEDLILSIKLSYVKYPLYQPCLPQFTLNV